MANQLTNPLGGRGTTGTVAKWSSPTTIGDSILTDSGTAISSSGPIRATGTSAAAPAFTGSDTDTGIYFPAANQVRIATSGSLAIAVDASQNVGIGTASPTAPVHAFGTSTTVAATTTASAGILRIEGSATNKLFVGSFSDASFGMYAQTNNVSYPISLQPAGGNVGIGTASPGAPLDVALAAGGGNNTARLIYTGALTANEGAVLGLGGYFTGTTATTFAYIKGAKDTITSGDYGGHLEFWTRPNGGSFAQQMTITSSGNVGIGVGTASPAGKLAILHSATNPNGLSSSTAIGALVLTNDGATAGSAYIRSAYFGGPAYDTGLQFGGYFYDGVSYKWTERMCIKGSGDVGIGTTSPTKKLDVNGAANITGALTVAGSVSRTSGSTAGVLNGAFIVVAVPEVAKAFLLSSTTTNNKQLSSLHLVGGDAATTGVTALYTFQTTVATSGAGSVRITNMSGVTATIEWSFLQIS